MKEVKPKEWIEAFDKEIEQQKDKLQTLLDKDHPLTHNEIDIAAEALTESMKQATAKVAPVRNLSARAKPWWDSACMQALN